MASASRPIPYSPRPRRCTAQSRFSSVGSFSSIAASSIARDLCEGINAPLPPSRHSEYDVESDSARGWSRPRNINALHRRFPSNTSATLAEEDGYDGDSDRSPLLAGPTTVYDSIGDSPRPDHEWESPLLDGQTESTWQAEAKVLGTYSRSLTLTFLLQQSLTVASVFAVGHIGTVELGAVSLATSTLDSEHPHTSLTDTT